MRIPWLTKNKEINHLRQDVIEIKKKVVVVEEKPVWEEFADEESVEEEYVELCEEE